MMYSLNEIGIIPSGIPTDINSRKQVNPTDENGKYPIFVSPMTSVINANNYMKFYDAGVIPVLPRNIKFDKKTSQKYWQSVSLQEFETMVNSDEDYNGCHVLVDIANGHIGKLYDLSGKFKNKNPESILMIGNIANPEIYKYSCYAGVDYVRCGVGGGSVCSTSIVTSCHSSLQYIVEGITSIRKEFNSMNINELKEKYPNFKLTKIIADGGVNTIGKAMVCLAIGYDYVMMGKLFAQCEEACGEVIYTKEGKQRKYYGMASEQGQIDISGGATKCPEGIQTFVPVVTNLEGFMKQFDAAIRSTMSYVGAHNLEEFRTNTKYEYMTDAEFRAFYK